MSRRSILKRDKLGYDSQREAREHIGATNTRLKGYHTSQCGGQKDKFTWGKMPRRKQIKHPTWQRVGTPTYSLSAKGQRGRTPMDPRPNSDTTVAQGS